MFNLARLQDPLFLFFTLFSVFYLIQGIRIGWSILVNRARWRMEPLRPWQKQQAEKAAFYLGIPPGVIVHELGHAVATWILGGQIVEYGYYFYWGYVVPVGAFSVQEDWFISLAGTLGSLIYAAFLWLLLTLAGKSPVRYLLLRAFRFQVYFTLIYYPVFTLLSFVGDWRIIYDFSQTPLLSGFTAVIHASLLLLFWLEDRRGRFEMVSFEDQAGQARYQDLRAHVVANPHDEAAQLAVVEAMRLGGAHRQAKSKLKMIIDNNPNSGEGYFQLAVLETRGRQLNRQSVAHYEHALQAGLSSPVKKGWAHSQLADYYTGIEKLVEARSHLDSAIQDLQAAAEPQQRLLLGECYHRRGVLERRQDNNEAARLDFQQAKTAISQAGDHQRALAIDQELQAMSNTPVGDPLNRPPWGT